MQIVIDIPDEEYKNIVTYNSFRWLRNNVIEAIQKSIPLPKGYGRLGDLDALYQEIKKRSWFDSDDTYYGGGLEAIVLDAPTIIKVDKEVEE